MATADAHRTMRTEKNCCFGCPYEMGTKIIGIFELTGNCLIGVLDTLQLNRIINFKGRKYDRLEVFSIVAELLLCVVMTVCSALLVYASYRRRRQLCKPWLIGTLAILCTRDLYSFFNHFHLALTGHPTAIVFLSVMAVTIGGAIYCWKIVYNFYRQELGASIATSAV